MSDDTLIQVDGVSKKFCRNLKKSLWYGMQDLGNEIVGRRHGDGGLRSDEFWAVKDVSFAVNRGECLGLIGRNGAGKTTLLRMLNGLIKPDTGRIEMRGRVGALIALGAGFNPILTGRENIYVNASVLGMSKRETDARVDEIIEFAELADFIDMPVQSYSSGMQVRLGFAIAATTRPDVLLLDEVLAVGDSAFRVKCFNRIHEILSECAVVFVSHNMAQITRICDSLLLLRQGNQVLCGPDMGAVIARYHQDSTVGVQPTVEGSGRFPIRSVSVHCQSGRAVERLAYGEPFSIRVTIDCAREQMPSILKLLITISDQEELNVAQVCEQLPQQVSNKEAIIRLDFASVPFNAGQYWLTVNSLIGDKGAFGCVYRRAAGFVVERGSVGYAPVILAADNVNVEH